MKAVLAAFNQEKALVGAFSVITNLRMELFEALAWTQPHSSSLRQTVLGWLVTGTTRTRSVTTPSDPRNLPSITVLLLVPQID